MATQAPDASTPSSLNSSTLHLPPPDPNHPKVGAHVIYVDGGVRRDALVQVVFTEYGMPPLTLVLVKPGSRGDLQTKRMVPHKSKCTNGSYWCRPQEAL